MKSFAGKTAQIESREVLLHGQDEVWSDTEATRSEVKMDAKSVTITVGPTASVTVNGAAGTPSAVIKIGENKINVTMDSIEITQGANSIKLSATGMTITGKPELTLSSEKFSAQSQMILLG